MILVIDFETVDPYISRKMGSGWVYGMVNPGSDFKVLGASVKWLGTDVAPAYYSCTDGTINNVLLLVHGAAGLVMHNAQYDFGCLLYLMERSGHCTKDLFTKDIYDTKVMSHLDNSSRLSHRLDDLAKELLGSEKNLDALRDAAYKADLKPWTKKELQDKKRAQKNGVKYIRGRPSDSILNRLAIQNMDKLPEEVVGHYCNRDVGLTEKLYQHFITKIEEEADKEAWESLGKFDDCWHPRETFNNLKKENIALRRKSILTYSNLAKVCCKNRLRGVPIDKVALTTNTDRISALTKEQEAKVYSLAGSEFNIHSSDQTVEVLASIGVKCPLTDKGNPSATTPWLEKRKEPLCKAIVKARQSYKIGNDFLTGVQDKLLLTDGENLYPELNILQARTGRFSATGPNIQQIPSDKVYGKICREVYYTGIPDSNTQFHALDYANQEGRLQLHYAIKLGCKGASDIGKSALDPFWDMHLDIARLIWGDSITKESPERRLAKTINLGLSYSMGIATLASQLEIDVNSAKLLIKEYHKAAPYLKELIKLTKGAMITRGYIKTIGGRKLTIDPPSDDRTFEYKALNKLIQGSAADQTIAAMVQADSEGLPVLFPVHDELVMIGTQEQAVRLQEIMVNCYNLVVPVIVTLISGNSWGDCK